MIRLEQAALSVAGHRIIDDATFHLVPSAKVGLIGRNGAGKTTLLRAILGETTPDTGKVHRRGQIRMGWLPQHGVSGSSLSVWEEVQQDRDHLDAMRAEIERAQARIESGDHDAATALADATERLTLAGGFNEEEVVGSVLHGLGFGPSTWHRPCDQFSGGWQMRIALARLLLSEPDVALLDEPTNHLDLHARSWLAGHLSRWGAAVIVVSHDRHLLDAVCTQMIELRDAVLHKYAGNFTAFVAEKELRAQTQSAAARKQQAEIAKLERFVERFGAKATKAAQARSKQKALDRMERVNAPKKESRGPRLSLPAAPAGSHEALALVDATIGYADSPPLLTQQSVHLERGMRLALLGPNGCGKSTLLRAMWGKHPIQTGRRRIDDRARVGLFHQDVAAALPGETTPLQYVSGQVPQTPPQRIRAVLGALGLTGDDALRPISTLSGGERARVALAGLAIQPHNVLLLDEPTNHLDIRTVSVLSQALSSFDGAMLLISHDRWVVEQVATHVALWDGTEMTIVEGVRPEHFKPVAATQGTARTSTRGKKDHASRKAAQRLHEKLQRQLERVQTQIEGVEAEIEALDQALYDHASDHARARTLSEDRDTAQQRLDGLYEDWESLELQVEEAKGDL